MATPLPPDVLRISNLTCVALTELIELALRMTKLPDPREPRWGRRRLRRCRGRGAALAHGGGGADEVAVWESVAGLGLLGLLVVDAQVPLHVRVPAVLRDELVLLRPRRPVLAPVVALV